MNRITEYTETSVINEGWFTLLAQRKSKLKYQSGGDRPRRLIAVFGGAEIHRGSPAWKRTFNLGLELAKQGAIVMNGGYGGIMEASAEGARSIDGDAVGITCDNLPVRDVNEFINQVWHVNRWDRRLLALVWLADGYIILPGESGTLVELSMVIETQLKGFIPARPIVCLGSYWKSVVNRIDGTRKMVSFGQTPQECVDMVIQG